VVALASTARNVSVLSLFQLPSATRRRPAPCPSCRFIGKSEPAIVVALWFHTSTALLSVVPLALSWPQAATPVGWFDALMLLGVSAGSFLGQLFMTRGLQLENASLISSLNFSQVSMPWWSLVAMLWGGVVGETSDGRTAADSAHMTEAP
jgi:drug/metabolite transporter (DMT)-like permease